ncbi:MAG: hypothetical protein AAFN77_17470 [Planctomycetota bacterium]
MSDKPTDPVELYAWLKQQISQLEKEMDEIKEDVQKAVDAEGGELTNEQYTLKTTKRPKYKFSEDYEQKNTELKELRKSEIDSGTATVESYSEFVTIRFKKS